MSRKINKQATDAEKAKRVHEVFIMLSESKSSATIYAFIEEKYGLKPRMARKYMQDATKVMKSMLEDNRENVLAVAVHQRQVVIEKLMETENYAMVSQAQGELARLLGLYDQPDVDATVVIKVEQE